MYTYVHVAEIACNFIRRNSEFGIDSIRVPHISRWTRLSKNRVYQTTKWSWIPKHGTIVKECIMMMENSDMFNLIGGMFGITWINMKQRSNHSLHANLCTMLQRLFLYCSLVTAGGGLRPAFVASSICIFGISSLNYHPRFASNELMWWFFKLWLETRY